MSGKPSSPVICVGLSAFDYIWRVERHPSASDAKVRAGAFFTRGGGMAATAAVAIARLGGRVAYWGRGGDDPEGRAMRDELAAAGVDVSAYRLFADGRSPISGVMVDASGERLIANFRGAELDPSPAWLPLERIGQAGAVLGDPRWPEGVEAAFAAARAVGVPTVLDAEVSEGGVFGRLLPLTDHAVFSAPALAAYAGASAEAGLAAVARHGCRVAAVTSGGDGVVWRDAAGRHRQPAYAVDVVDTTGAGDVFHGAYALALAGGATVAEAMAFAAAAAALKCTKPGGRAGIPTYDETIALQRTRA